MAGQQRSSLIDVDDGAFMATLAAALERLQVDGEQGLARTAIDVTNRAKQMCAVDTGRLRAATTFTPLQRDEQGAYVDVGVFDAQMRSQGAATNYGWFVEYGTVHMPAQPFMRPALAEVSGGTYTMMGG